MEDNRYLVAAALAEQGGKRIMPLGGKSLKKSSNLLLISEEARKLILLDLLVRVFERSDNSQIKRANGDDSLLVFEINFEKFNTYLPNLKSEWISKGNSKLLLLDLKENSYNLWTAIYKKYEGLILVKK